ncbi:hypothetical protein H0H81_002121, partial [Sphagnurus paluster]
FVNALVGEEVAKVGSGLDSETTEVQHYFMPALNFPGKRVIVLDTPGFDYSDPKVPDDQIIEGIATWLKNSYPAGMKMKLAGVIYLHEITQDRFNKMKILDQFHTRCHDRTTKNTIFITTKWDHVNQETGSKHEANLRNQQDMKKILIMLRWDPPNYTPLDIMNLILGRKVGGRTLEDLQKELEQPSTHKQPQETSSIKAEVRFENVVSDQQIAQLYNGSSSQTTPPQDNLIHHPDPPDHQEVISTPGVDSGVSTNVPILEVTARALSNS